MFEECEEIVLEEDFAMASEEDFGVTFEDFGVAFVVCEVVLEDDFEVVFGVDLEFQWRYSLGFHGGG